MEFEIQRCARRCASSDRELLPGDVVYSVLVGEGAAIERRDFAEESWTGPPENAVGWWQAKIPTPEQNRVKWAPHEVMLHYFIELEAAIEQEDLRYVLALLMIRRRILRLEGSQSDGAEGEQLVLYCPSNETEYQVSVATPEGARVQEIQHELARLLFQ